MDIGTTGVTGTYVMSHVEEGDSIETELAWNPSMVVPSV